MRKWLLFFAAGLSLLGLSPMVLAASDDNMILPTDDTVGCSPLIQQGGLTPPRPTPDLNRVQMCMSRCDVLYKSLRDQGRFDEMVRGGNYCHKSLNNLYFASVADITTQQLNQQSAQQQSSERESAFERMSALIKQQMEQQNARNNAAASNTQPPESSTANAATTPPPPVNPSTPVGPPDDVHW